MTMLADEDAAAGDYAHAIDTLDSAAALSGGVLPPELEQRRAVWVAAEPARLG